MNMPGFMFVCLQSVAYSKVVENLLRGPIRKCKSALRK